MQKQPLWFAALVLPCAALAASLQPETVAAWNDYLNAVNCNLHERAQPGGSFLWTFENQGRAARVRRGELVVEPASGHNPAKVPGGLIHHWMGAMFLPGLQLEDVLEVTRDYDRYKKYYSPSVVQSRTIARDSSKDLFSIRIMNKSFFLTTALDADYQTTNVRLDQDRFYSISRTTRLQQVEECGEPGEHRMPEGTGGGYIWKLFSILRLEQRDGGVYMEFEAIALSRDIPAAARFLVDPVVRRISRNSLLTSLRQTQQALSGRPALVARRHAYSNQGSAFTGAH